MCLPCVNDSMDIMQYQDVDHAYCAYSSRAVMLDQPLPPDIAGVSYLILPPT